MYDEYDKELRAKYPMLYTDIECTSCGKLMALSNAIRKDYQYLCFTCNWREEMPEEKFCLTCPNIIEDERDFCPSCGPINDAEKKTPEMESFLNKVAGSMFGRTRDEANKNKVCVMCGNDASKFTDLLSEKEYKISHLCQSCQDKTFHSE